MSQRISQSVYQKADPIELRPHQVEHYHAGVNILNFFNLFLDLSGTGTGKSVSELALAATAELSIFVISPKAAIDPVWRTRATKYGIPIIHLNGHMGIISYGILSGKKLKGVQDQEVCLGLLRRTDVGRIVNFYPTPLLDELLARGVMFIFDEFQKLKNSDSMRARAALIIINRLYQFGGRSRAIFASGTSMDKEEQALNYLKIFGIINSPKLYEKPRGRAPVLQGLQELINWGHQWNSEATNIFLNKQTEEMSQKVAKKFVYEFYQDVFRPRVSHAMSNQLDYLKKIYNLFCPIPEDDKVNYTKGINRLIMAIAKAGKRLDLTAEELEEFGVRNLREIPREKLDFQEINGALIQIHLAKIRLLAGLVKKDLMTERRDAEGNLLNHKIIVYIHYYKQGEMDLLLNFLKEWHPVEFTGRLTDRRREENRKLFQTYGSIHRVLITHPTVGGVAVDLHDEYGDEPRDIYSMVNYDINNAKQISGRTIREGTKSYSNIYFVFGIVKTQKSKLRTEQTLLDSLAKKGEIMKRTNPEFLETGDQFHGDFESIMIEPVDEKYLPDPLR